MVHELNPGDVGAHQAYANYLTQLGRLDEALTEAKRSVELDPLALMPNSYLAWAYYRSRKFDEALEQARVPVSALSEAVRSISPWML